MFNETFKMSKSVYSIESILKAAYFFVDKAYMHIEDVDEDWIVTYTLKPETVPTYALREEFENELIAQQVRQQVYDRTHTLRELLMARAMTSTIIDTQDPIEQIEAEETDISDEELDDILTNWFEK